MTRQRLLLRQRLRASCGRRGVCLAPGGYDAPQAVKSSSIAVDSISSEADIAIWHFRGMARNLRPQDPTLTAQIRENKPEQDHAAESLKTRTVSDSVMACRFRLSAAAADSSTSAEFCCVT